MVQVNLHNNRKIRGRLSVVTRKGFVIQIAAGDKTGNEKISFDDIESIKAIEMAKELRCPSIFVVEGGAGGGVDVQIEH